MTISPLYQQQLTGQLINSITEHDFNSVKFFVDQGAIINNNSDHLVSAAQTSLPIFQYLYEHGANKNQITHALSTAAHHDCLDIVQYLLKHETFLESDVLLSLSFAVSHDNVNIVEYLMETVFTQPPYNSGSHFKKIPAYLFNSAVDGNLKVFKYLILEQQANILSVLDDKTKFEMHPNVLSWALTYKHNQDFYDKINHDLPHKSELSSTKMKI